MTKKQEPAYKSGILVFVLILIADQISKYAALVYLQPGVPYDLISGLFSFTLTFNPGVAFGMFADFPGVWRIAFVAASNLTALGVLGYFMYRYRYNSKGQVVLWAILAGAAGNIIDRMRFGHVVDFLDFYYQNYHWPAFNIADSSICVAVVLLIFMPLEAEAQSEAG